MTFLLAFLAGAAWRRWFGSARPDWAFSGYRAMQIAIGIGVLALIAGASLAALVCAAAAIGWMTLPISVSRAPFVWLLDVSRSSRPSRTSGAPPSGRSSFKAPVYSRAPSSSRPSSKENRP